MEDFVLISMLWSDISDLRRPGSIGFAGITGALSTAVDRRRYQLLDVTVLHSPQRDGKNHADQDHVLEKGWEIRNPESRLCT